MRNVLATVALALTLHFTAALVPSLRAEGTSYTFTRIADSSGPLRELLVPTLNDRGTVAFLASLDAGGQAIMKGDGNQLVTVADSTTFSEFNPPAINNRDTVAFAVRALGSGSGLAVYAATRDNAIRLVVDRSDGFTDLSTLPGLTDGNVVVFSGSPVAGGQSIAERSVYGGPITTIADSTAFAGLDQAPTVNNHGTVAFTGSRLGSGLNGVFTVRNGVTTTVVDSSGPFHVFSGGPSINARGRVVFHALLDAGSGGVFTSSADGVVRQIADDSGTFVGLSGGPALNNRGTVAFRAALPNGGAGLFTGPDAVADRVIATGDLVDGRVVIGLQFFRGLNNRGQLAFVAYFSDNSIALFRADPNP